MVMAPTLLWKYYDNCFAKNMEVVVSGVVQKREEGETINTCINFIRNHILVDVIMKFFSLVIFNFYYSKAYIINIIIFN